MGKRTAVWRWVDEYLVEVFGSEEIRKEEWDELMVEIAGRRKSLRGVLVAAGSASPSATQRAQLSQALQGVVVPAAILTGSAMVRVALTAINYFVRGQARPFAQDQMEPALAYLNVPQLLWPQIRQTIVALQAQLGGRA